MYVADQIKLTFISYSSDGIFKFLQLPNTNTGIFVTAPKSRWKIHFPLLFFLFAFNKIHLIFAPSAWQPKWSSALSFLSMCIPNVTKCKKLLLSVSWLFLLELEQLPFI